MDDLLSLPATILIVICTLISALIVTATLGRLDSFKRRWPFQIFGIVLTDLFGLIILGVTISWAPPSFWKWVDKIPPSWRLSRNSPVATGRPMSPERPGTQSPPHRFPHGPGPPLPSEPTLEAARHTCENLVDGMVLFKPDTQMRQGQTYQVFARVSRKPGVDIRNGLDSSFTVESVSVSCKVEVRLDSQESNAFQIDKLPADRQDAQMLVADTYTQWDWRVMPKKHGTLHLLLYVTPILYFNGSKESGTKNFDQPAKVITVRPDYWFEAKTFVTTNWAVLSGLGTLLVTVGGWLIAKRKARAEKNKRVGFSPVIKGKN
jgi:hypothetical protein